MHSQHPLSARSKRCQLQGILIGLSTAIAEEELIVRIARQLAQLLGQLNLQAIHHSIRVEANLRELVGDFLDIMGVSVTNRNHSVTTIEVEVLHTILIPQIGSLGLHRLHIEQRIYIKKFHNQSY